MNKEEMLMKKYSREYWSKKVSDVLVGKKIVKVKYLEPSEAKQIGDWHHQPIEIILEDGGSLIPMRDDEGNGPGAISTNYVGLETIPIFHDYQ
tara:strand:- start:848 stop:1126 length:279 start_codon:yes stop_codon:yes gene_type:complete